MRLVQLWKQETGLDWTKTATEVESELDQTDSISYSEVEEDVNSGTSKDNAEYVYPKSFFTGNGARTCSERLEEEKNGFLSRTLLSGSTKETFPASPHKVRLSRECSWEKRSKARRRGYRRSQVVHEKEWSEQWAEEKQNRDRLKWSEEAEKTTEERKEQAFHSRQDRNALLQPPIEGREGGRQYKPPRQAHLEEPN
jgi:hypothetical protein